MEKKKQQIRATATTSSCDEGIGLWRQAVSDVTPLKKNSATAFAAGTECDSNLQTGSKTSCHSPRSDFVKVKGPLVPLSHGTLVGLDKRTGERLKRGKLEVEGRLDMHGMSQATAYRALKRFLLDKQAAGKRCVVVITGKGSRDGGTGVLKEAVPRWLNEPSLRKHVLGFDYALPRLGGTGALYILLRRKRL
ncbi:MAG: Smr/MutS family protein [Pseudomonadota bacterium]|nr:Smr/MutS family protein [Pseudomonadota bacterium]